MTFLKPFYIFLALLVLQLIPYSGVFLMMFGGGLITGLLLHLIFVLMAFDALTRRGPPVLLLVPALFYGGYYIRYFQQDREIARITAELAGTNPGRIFDFDPNAHSLVMQSAGGFVSTHDIPVAYEANKSFLPEGYLSRRLIPRAQCSAVKKDSQSRIQTWRVHGDGVFQKGVCQLQYPEAPPHRIVAVDVTSDQRDGKTKAEVHLRSTSIVVDGGTLGVYRTASVARLPKFPWLYIGCALNSAAPAWQCDAAAVRSSLAIDGTPAGVDRAIYDTPVAVMLGIRKYPPGALNGFQGFPQNAYILQAVERERLRVEDEAFAALETVLSGGAAERFHNLDFALAQNPPRLEPYAERMARRLIELEEAEPPQAGKSKYRRSRQDERRALATAIAAMSPQAFAPLAERMFGLAQRERFWEEYGVLYLRAADAGPQTLAFFKEQFLGRQVERNYEALPVLALCRIGVADAAIVEEMKARYILPDGDKWRQSNRQAALFLALLRFGEAEFLRANEPLAARQDRAWREALLSGKGQTAVGPNNCMTETRPVGYRPKILAPSLVRGRNGWETAPN